MARGVNKVILVGTLGRDPEVKYAANGNAIANLSIATSEQWNDRATGEKQEKTEWHRVVIFGKLADIAGQYLKKGSQVYLEGKLQTRKWADATTGQDRYATEVVIDFNGQMQMLGGGGGRSDAAFDSGGSAGGFAPQMQAPQGNAGGYGQQAPMQQSSQNYGGGQQQQGGYQQNQMQQAPAQNNSSPMQRAPAYTPNDFDDDDVPF